MKIKKIDTDKLFFSKTWYFLNEYMPNRLNRSPKTIASYRDSLSIFRRFVAEKLNISMSKFKFSDCSRDCIFDFRDYLKQKGNAPSLTQISDDGAHSFM